MKHPTWCCLIFKSEWHSILSISCSFLSNSKGKCALLVLSPLGKPQTQFILNVTRVSNWLYPVNSVLEEFWKQVKSYFPGTFPPSPLPSLINNTLDAFRSPHSQCLWLCHQNTKASLFSCSPCFIFISIQSLDPLQVTQPSIRPTLLCFFDAVSPEKIKWLQTNVLLPVTLVNQQRI